MNGRQVELKVFISHQDSVSSECREKLGSQAWIFLAEQWGALCLACADLEHLAFLPSGDTALTRRARKHSRLSAVVLKWSRARRRYERQGLLVEEESLEKAEEESLQDEAIRARRRERGALAREKLDRQYVGRFAERIGELFPRCPPARRHVIAEHACRKYSGRVGRAAAAKRLDEQAVRLAVTAHVRHVETPYDQLLGTGCDRFEARGQVSEQVARVLAAWTG